LKLWSLGFLPVLLCATLFPQTTRNLANITGSVQTSEGHPVDSARVTAINASGVVVGSAYTNTQGYFEIKTLPPGRYEIIADHGISESRERIDTRLSDLSLTLRLPKQAVDTVPSTSEGTVSIAAFRVPGKARKAYEKAAGAMAKGKFDEVDKYVGEALAIYPDYAEALTLRAIRELDKQKIEAAIDDLDHAIKVDASLARAHLVLASAFNIQKRFDDAIRILTRASSLAPNAWQGYYEMAKAYFGKEKFEDALRWINRAQSQAPKQFAGTYLTKAQILVALKQDGEALHELEAFLVNAPKDPQAAQVRAMIDQMKVK
jgi:tetratricopeptide (TPR) repeat protein